MDTDDFLNQAPIANPQDEYELSEEEKEKVFAAWDAGAQGLKEIIAASVGPQFDGRSKQGKAVKALLASRQLSARPAQVYTKKTSALELTDDQKEFIATNAGSMKPLEMAKTLFDMPTITALSTQFRVVKAYYDTLDVKVRNLSPDEDVKDYNPPKMEDQAIARINKYVFEGIDRSKITPKQKESVQRLIKFMHTFKFLLEIRNLNKISERELFESSFVRFTYDKPDLTEEEVELYINYCADVVGLQRMKRELTDLSEAMEFERNDNGKIPMAYVEAMGKLRSDIDNTTKRQEKTLQSLNGKRADRLGEIQANSTSILKLIENFRGEEKRKRFLGVIQARKEKLKKEVVRLESVDDLHFDMFGASPEELA